MRIKFIQKVIDFISQKNKVSYSLNKDYENVKDKQIISASGFFYSGSSALIGLFSECANTTVYGSADNLYSQKSLNLGLEVKFFTYSGLLELADCLKSPTSSDLEKDIKLKAFIANIYRGYTQKNLAGYDYSPIFFNINFLKASKDFLYSIIDFNDIDLKVLSTEEIPVITGKYEIYKDCSFVYGEGIQSYIFYKTKKLSIEEIDSLVSKYIKKLFNTFITKDYLVFDQLLRHQNYKEVNAYLKDKPIKLISVCRDPRDQFLSAFRYDTHPYLPRTINEFTKWYKEKINNAINVIDENHLLIRFEDLVLNYDETTKKIFDFCGIDKKQHIAPKSIFNPDISVMNIGAWKNFHDQEFMKQIEDRLGEYCYYDKEENVSDKLIF